MSKELRALAEAATPGPWINGNDEDSDYRLVGPAAFDDIVTHPVVKLHDERDADYIAAVSPDVVLGLLDRIDAAQPDCRTCTQHSFSQMTRKYCCSNAVEGKPQCNSGDQYVEAPRVVLWRTE